MDESVSLMLSVKGVVSDGVLKKERKKKAFDLGPTNAIVLASSRRQNKKVFRTLRVLLTWSWSLAALSTTFRTPRELARFMLHPHQPHAGSVMGEGGGEGGGWESQGGWRGVGESGGRILVQ